MLFILNKCFAHIFIKTCCAAVKAFSLYILSSLRENFCQVLEKSYYCSENFCSKLLNIYPKALNKRSKLLNMCSKVWNKNFLKGK